MGKKQTLLDIGQKLHHLQTRFKKLKATDFKTKSQKTKFQITKRRFNQLVDDIHALYEKAGW